jgi:hypothetical protein
MTSRHHSLESSKMDLRKGSQDLLETRIQVAQEEGGGPAAALVQSWEILPVLDLGYVSYLRR